MCVTCRQFIFCTISKAPLPYTCIKPETIACTHVMQCTLWQTSTLKCHKKINMLGVFNLALPPVFEDKVFIRESKPIQQPLPPKILPLYISHFSTLQSQDHLIHCALAFPVCRRNCSDTGHVYSAGAT